jgi:peptidoglycan hydrolase-like protein with peptidoglycan-binding domain
LGLTQKRNDIINMTTPATIKQGSSGAVVKQWQQVLGVTADGKFGPATTTATKTWQGKHGLKADGVVGPATWTAAQPVTVAVKPIIQSTTTGTVVKTTVTTTKPTLKQGSSGSAVIEWQKILGVTADGKFGPATTTATKTWQSARGLKSDGIVGAQSWNAAAINAPIINKPQAFAPVTTPQSEFTPSTTTDTSTSTTQSTVESTIPPVVASTGTVTAPLPNPVPVTPSPLGSFVPVTTPAPNPPVPDSTGSTDTTNAAQIVVPIPTQTAAVTAKFTFPTWSKWLATILALAGFGYGIKYTKEHRSTK